MEEEKNEPSLTLPELQQFFEERKGVINISPIAIEAGLSQVHLRRILKGEGTLTEKSSIKLLPVLKRYGYRYTPTEDKEPSLTLGVLQQFFREREKAISRRALGQEAGLAEGYLNKIIRGDRGLSKKTIVKLLPVLQKYGYQE